jgi:hypothetical protein
MIVVSYYVNQVLGTRLPRTSTVRFRNHSSYISTGLQDRWKHENGYQKGGNTGVDKRKLDAREVYKAWIQQKWIRENLIQRRWIQKGEYKKSC